MSEFSIAGESEIESKEHTESEIEDLLDSNLYRKWIFDEYGVDLSLPTFKTKKKCLRNKTLKNILQVAGIFGLNCVKPKM